MMIKKILCTSAVILFLLSSAFSTTVDVALNYDNYAGETVLRPSFNADIPFSDSSMMNTSLIYNRGKNYSANFTTSYVSEKIQAGGGLCFNFDPNAVYPGISVCSLFKLAEKIKLGAAFGLGLNAQNVLEPSLFNYTFDFIYTTTNAIAQINLKIKDETPSYTKRTITNDTTIIAYEEGIPFTMRVGFGFDYVEDSRFAGKDSETTFRVLFGYDKLKNKNTTFFRCTADVFSINKPNKYPFCLTIGKTFF